MPTTSTEAFYSLMEILKRFEHSLQKHTQTGQVVRRNLEEEIENLEYKIAKNAEKLEKRKRKHMKEGSMGTQQQQEEANRACVLEMLKIECEEELKVKEEKLKKRAERKHKMAMNRMEKQIHHQIINVKRERRMICLACSKVSIELLSCGGCEDAFYCNESCQKDHWKIHKYFCQHHIESR